VAAATAAEATKTSVMLQRALRGSASGSKVVRSKRTDGPTENKRTLLEPLDKVQQIGYHPPREG
jgi:hypothetical protein